MGIIPGYNIIREMQKNKDIIIYEGIRIKDKKTVLIKTYRKGLGALKKESVFKYEYGIAINLNIKEVLVPYEIVKYTSGIALISEYFNGDFLEKYISEKKRDIKTFLKLAINISKSVCSLHHNNIVHTDINPLNIMVNTETYDIKILNLGNSLILNRGNKNNHPNLEEITSLQYISPEQTGRIKKDIDFSTDLYLLGITLYEMLLCRVPFSAENSMELIHCHMAKAPIPPHEYDREIPEAVSNIIMKLLSKCPEDRYKSACGIANDLQTCLQQLENNKNIQNFKLGERDIPCTFTISSNLYGKEKEVNMIMSRFTSVCEGNKEVMIISGDSGIGKSSLIKVMQNPIIQYGGYFISSKCDKHKKNIPYNFVISILKESLDYILSEREEIIEYFKNEILNALNGSIQTLISMLPELEIVLGKQSVSYDVGAAKYDNVIKIFFEKFIKVFISKEHPLVIFIDNLQWADLSSLKLLNSLLIESKNPYLFIVGAYAEKDLHEFKYFNQLINEIKNTNITLNKVKLKPLTLEEINTLISDSFYLDEEEVRPLSQIVLNKTQGNLFFIKQYLKELFREGLVQFNNKSRHWNWDIEKIKQHDITDDLIEFLIKKINKLSESTKYILKLAACIGNEFDLKTLLLVDDFSQNKLLNGIQEAVKEGFILEVKKTGKNFQCKNKFTDREIDIKLKFIHNRIHEVVYAMIDIEKRKLMHIKISKLILKNKNDNEIYKDIFEIITHYNKGKEYITDIDEKRKLVELNYRAGKKAKISNAYASAAKYFDISISLLEDNSWQQDYELTYKVYIESVECSYLNSNFEKAEKLFGIILRNVKNKPEMTNVYILRISFFIMQGKYEEAINIGFIALKMFNIEFSKKISILKVKFQIFKTKVTLRHNKSVKVTHLNDMVDENKIIVMKLLDKLSIAAYFTSKDLLFQVLIKQLKISMQCGNIDCANKSYAYYCSILSSLSGNSKLSYELGMESLKLTEKNNCNINVKMFSSLGNMVILWKKHLKVSLDYLLKGYWIGRQRGDLIEAAYCAIGIVYAKLQKGDNLEEVNTEIDKYIEFLHEIKYEELIDYLFIIKEMIEELTDSKSSKSLFKYTDNKKKGMKGNTSKEIIGLNYFYKIRVYYIMGYHNNSIPILQQSEQIKNVFMGTAILPEFYFYNALTLTASYNNAENKDKKIYLKNIKKINRIMRKWADNCPENFLHKHLLISAEIARIEGRELAAIKLYDKAINSAIENEYIHNAAIGNELSGNFFKTKGLDKIASTYFVEARNYYYQWGAIAKVKQLEYKYPYLGLSIYDSDITNIEVAATKEFTEKINLEMLDLDSVIKASQIISSEIVMDKLLKKLISIVIENAGAQRGVLLLKEEGKLVVEAEAIAQGRLKIMQSIQLDEYNLVSKSVINYVYRTKQNIILSNASEEGIFIFDDYIKNNKLKSILCFPIMYKGLLTGIIYLENNLAPDIFTEERLEVVRLLSSQAAISIENARMYKKIKNLNHTLEEKVNDRTNELIETIKKLEFEINERKITEEKLRKSKEKYRTFFNMSPIFIYLIDAIEDKVIEANPAMINKLGVSIDEINKYGGNHFYVGDDWSRLEELYGRIKTGETLTGIEVCVKTSEGEIFYLENSFIPISEEGIVKRILCLGRDITENKRIEEVTRREEEKTKLLNEVIEYDKLKTEFFANLSHELRTPLNVILGCLQLFDVLPRETFKSDSGEKVKKYLSVMKQNCYRLVRLVNNLIDITKIEDGYFKVNLNNYNIVRVIEDITMSVAEYIENKGIELIFDTDIEEKTLACDEEKIERIILNLLSNAIKFTDAGGTIMVTISDKEESIVISVKDTGIGIPKEKQATVFERFIQVDKSLSRNHEGSGIGLSLVKALVEMHSGTISLKSEEGKGSEFIIELPIMLIGEGNNIDEESECLEAGNIEKISIEFSDIYD